MKKNKWLTLLCLALGASTLFTACGGGTTSSSGDSSSTDEAAKVEATFSNFIDTQYKEEWQDLSYDVSTLNNEYGTCVDGRGGLYLFKETDKTALNEVQQTWTLYDVKTAQVVFTKEHKYEDGDYEGYDKYDNEKHAPVEVDVELSSDSVPYVKVTTTSYEKYSDAEMEEMIFNLAVNGGVGSSYLPSYKTQTTTEYYSVDGKLICSTKLENVNTMPPNADDFVNVLVYSEDKNYVLFGRTMAVLKNEDGALLDTWNAETEDRAILYDENDKYGYTEALYGAGMAMEVYNKEDGTLVYRYVIDFVDMMMGGMNFGVLESGDFVIQETEDTYNASYDFLQDGEKKNVITKRIDVETGKITEVEWNYLVDEFYMAEEWDEDLGDELGITDNVYNVALVNKIENGEIGKKCYVFFDNALNVQYEWAPLIPEQTDLTDIDVLATGDLLVQLDSPVMMMGEQVDRAIVKKDGTLVRYVPYNARVFEEYMLLDLDGAYVICDLDGERVSDILQLPTYNNQEWGELQRFGNGFICGGQYYDEYNGEWVHQIFRIYKEYGGWSYSTSNYQLEEANPSYVIFLDEDTKTYELRDAEMNCILETEYLPTVVEYDDCYVVEAWVNGERMVYVISFEEKTNYEDVPDWWEDKYPEYDEDEEEGDKVEQEGGEENE